MNSVKPVNEVTSIKQSLVLKGFDEARITIIIFCHEIYKILTKRLKTSIGVIYKKYYFKGGFDLSR
jgi:hypothetical protein